MSIEERLTRIEILLNKLVKVTHLCLECNKEMTISGTDGSYYCSNCLHINTTRPEPKENIEDIYSMSLLDLLRH